MLYRASREESAKKKSRLVESQIETMKKANTVFTNPVTNKIINSKKAESFHQIFVWLDSDRDGLISAMKIDISMIDSYLLEVFSPILIELEELGQPLDEEEFTDALTRLYDTLALPQKECLLLKHYQRHGPKQEDLGNFQPMINANSRAMAELNHKDKNVTQRLYPHQPPKKRQATQSSDLQTSSFIS